MKKFLTVALGSFVGAWIALMISSVLSIFVGFAMMGAMSGISPKKPQVTKDCIAVLDLNTIITERTVEDEFSMMFGSEQKTVGLDELMSAIAAAKDNDKVKALYIKCGGVSSGFTTLYDLRKAIADFKTSEKPVYAYGYDGVTQGDYYIASVADSIFINPEGILDLHGLASQNMFFKNLLDKIGVKMQVIRVGTFKSAVEPYMLTEISDANKMQQEAYIGSIWNTLSEDMTSSRKISSERFQALTDSLVGFRGAEALVKEKLADAICYRSEMEAKLMSILGVDSKEDLNLVNVADIPSESKNSAKDKIVVLFAEGEIDGAASGEGINSKELCDEIAKLQDDDDVKGMVLRVNSPGGSAFGSEQIWKALEDFKAEGKHLVVSMGDLAASGGYYISCGAEVIYAEPTTLTGSIGIFGLIPSLEQLATDKIGINISTVKTNANGDFGTLMQDLSPMQKEIMQQYVNRGYELFTKRCADGRGVAQDSIKVIAEGRVWDGKNARKIGLVDEFGTLNDAIARVAKICELEDYQVVKLPVIKSSLERLMEKYGNMYVESKMRDRLGMLYDYKDIVERILSRDKMLCLMAPIELK